MAEGEKDLGGDAGKRGEARAVRGARRQQATTHTPEQPSRRRRPASRRSLQVCLRRALAGDQHLPWRRPALFYSLITY